MKLLAGAVLAVVGRVVFAVQPAFSQNAADETAASLKNPTPIATATSSSARVYENLYEGAKMSLQLRDVAGIAAGVFLDRQRPSQSLKLAPFEVDEEISESLARTDGKKSLGALSPVYYPGITATARLAGMIALDAVGLHDYSAATYARMIRFQQALYYTKVVTMLAKSHIQRYRPDGSDTHSFFSGHTSIAFATSTFLYLEARDFIDGLAQRRAGSLPLLSPRSWKRLTFGALYGWAGYVGFSRIHDKKHYLSDVLVGAASGMLVSYWVYPHQTKNEKIQIGLQPLVSGAGLALGIKF
jgi:membrane-associated phospholipid phosphatase